MADELATGTPAPAAPETPSFIELKEDSLIKPPGMEKPVAYKDFLGSYVPKADLTRMRQSDTQSIERERQAIKQEQAQLQKAAQALTERLGPAKQPGDEIYAQLESLPYLDGKQAAHLIRQIVGSIQQRDQAIGILRQELTGLKQGFGSLTGENRKAATQALQHEALKASGLPDNEHTRGLVEEQYLAHDGWDTVSREDQIAHLAKVAKARFDGIIGAQRAADRQRVEDARRPTVPGDASIRARRQPPSAGSAQGTPEAIAKKLFASLPHNAPDS